MGLAPKTNARHGFNMRNIIQTIIYPLTLGFVFGAILSGCSRSGGESGASKPGKMTESRTEPSGNTLEDAWLHAQIVSKLIADPATPPRKINVDVVDKVVTLRGVVESTEQKDQADILAQETQGVRKVNNQLKVVPQSPTVSRSLMGMILAAAAGKK